jgi:hypothetical protein
MDLTTYNKIRDTLQTGDLIQWRSDTLLGSAIRYFSHGPVNHSGLVVRLDDFKGMSDRVWTLEAMDGIELHRLSRRLKEFKGDVWIYPLKDEYDNLRSLIACWAAEKEGTPYDFGSLFRNVLGKVNADARRLFCSEYAYLAYHAVKIVRLMKAPTPADMPGLGIFKEPIMI